jgi:hypothetical protein
VHAGAAQGKKRRRERQGIGSAIDLDPIGQEVGADDDRAATTWKLPALGAAVHALMETLP